MSICNEFLLCKKFMLSSKTADVFGMLNDFLKVHGISWNKIGSISIDGAPSMLGHKSGFVSLIKEVVPDVVTIHCAIYRQALTFLPESLKELLSTVVLVVNFIQEKAL